MNRIDPQTIPFDVAVLPMCRCGDCRNWQAVSGCRKFGRGPQASSKALPKTSHRTGGGIEAINSKDWLYCLYYRGPNVSRRILVLPNGDG